MKKLTKREATFVIVLCVVLVIVGARLLLIKNAKDMDPVMARAKGPKDAKVSVIEFMDFQCPACAAGAMKLNEYVEKHPQDIHVQMRYFPLPQIHRHAITAAMYAQCAAYQGMFWPVHNVLILHQAQWKDLLNAQTMWDGWAKSQGVDIGRLNTCMQDQKTKDSVEADRLLGQSLGIQSTPTYFINQKMVVGPKSLTDELDTYFKD